MIVFDLIYIVKKNQSIINIFNPYFVYKFSVKCRIIYCNKIYPLIDQICITDPKIEQFKIKLISFIDINIFDIELLTNGCECLIDYCENIKYKKENNTFIKYRNQKFHQFSKMIYKCGNYDSDYINGNLGNFRIFGQNFVNKNKLNCIIKYKNKIFPLKEFFIVKNLKSDNEEKNYEILLK